MVRVCNSTRSSTSDTELSSKQRASRQSSMVPSVGQSPESSVAVDYSTWGYGDGVVTPMATYAQAAFGSQDAEPQVRV